LLEAINVIRGLAVALLLFLPSPVSAQLVTQVIDGDTIVVQGVGSVRLIGVDTPETVDPRKPAQFFLGRHPKQIR
jgi:endonuclease YncB( thermonuclease family)